MPSKQKSLKELVAERAKKAGSGAGRHKAVFTALMDEIEETLAEGYKMRIVWETLRDKRGLTMSYDTFRRLCHEAGFRNASRIRKRAAADGSADAKGSSSE